MIDDILKSIKASLYDRTSSPLFGTFLVSWCAWNFKLFIIIFSDTEVNSKLSLIDSFFNSPNHGYFGAPIPLVATLLWIFVYPYPSRWVYGFAKEQQIKLITLLQEKEKETPLPLEAVQEIRRWNNELIETQKRNEAIIDIKNKEIESLKKELTKEQQNNIEYTKQKTTKAPDQSLNDDEIRILQHIASEQEVHRNTCVNILNINNVTADHYIDRLLEKNFITQGVDYGGNLILKITPLGRAYLVENKLT